MKRIKAYMGDQYKEFPTLEQNQLDKANDLFDAYLFFRRDRKTGEHHLWTSCCHMEDYIIEQQRTLSGPVVQCTSLSHNEVLTCPFCGKMVVAKNLSKAGKRRSLRDYRCVVFLNAEQDTPLYAQAYIAHKEYGTEKSLSAYPDYIFEAAYIFQPGNPVIIEEDYYGKRLYRTEGRRTREPFRSGYIYWYRYVGYQVIGKDAIYKSCCRFSQYDKFKQFCGCFASADFNLMRYMSTWCLYPQIEMLMKMGLKQTVFDLVMRQVKNAAAIDWSQSDPRKAFGLTKPELDYWLHLDNPKWEDVAIYKRLKRHGQKVSFQWLCELDLENKIGLVRICQRHRCKFVKAIHYLDKFTGPRCYGGWFGLDQALEYWKDYLINAERLDYALNEQVVFMPKDLFEAHDNAAGASVQVSAEEETQTFLKLTKKLDLRYSFQMAGYHIRPPASTKEIIAEGKALRHCVGGYAERHALGKTTILFLRSDDAPYTPLVTIEMNGNRMVQIHGYQNDRGQQNPKERYASIVGPFLEWVSAGSKRDKDGKPIIAQRERVRIA